MQYTFVSMPSAHLLSLLPPSLFSLLNPPPPHFHFHSHTLTFFPPLKPNRLSQSRSQRILFLLEHLQLPYALKTYQRDKNRLAPPALKEVHPLGKAPMISIEAANNTNKPLVLPESGLIVEYLVEHFGPELAPQRYALKGGEGEGGGEEGVGQETESWMRYRYFMHYAEGSLMPFLVIGLLLNGTFHPSLKTPR